MTGNETSENQDWVIPAVLVAVIAVLGLTVAVFLGIRATSGDDDSIAGQLERWSSCLRSEGANVPHVETLRGGGFRITVDGSFVEEGIDMEALGPAFDECANEAPEGVRKLIKLLDGFSEFPFGDFGSGFFGFEEASRLPSTAFDGAAP
jgi:hypothetical protein